ncbi:hypothetical protein ACRPLG_02640 [Bacillus safensis]|uniref:hypothetical protein n=1 Tax=Bacillus safensis TaxID=561879 RepID=UPI003D785F10
MITYIALFCLAILALAKKTPMTYDEILGCLLYYVLLFIPIAVLLAHVTGANI